LKLNENYFIVTGAGSGIGQSVCEILIANNAKVIGVDLKLDTVPTGVIGYQGDVSDLDFVQNILDFAATHWPRVDCFVANAGFAYFGDFLTDEKQNEAAINRIFQTNTLSPIRTYKEIHSRFGGKAKLVQVASAMAYLPLPSYALYSATKAALHAFSKSVRWESGESSTLMTVYPIATRTQFFQTGAHLPWPSQAPLTVAKQIVRGIESDARTVSPSVVFTLFWTFARALPFLGSIYQWIEHKRNTKR
jgi:short-subunit dehydrogenase